MLASFIISYLDEIKQHDIRSRNHSDRQFIIDGFEGRYATRRGFIEFHMHI